MKRWVRAHWAWLWRGTGCDECGVVAEFKASERTIVYGQSHGTRSSLFCVGVVAAVGAALGRAGGLGGAGDIGRGGLQGAGDEVGDEGVGRERRSVLDGEDAELEEVAKGVFGDVAGHDDFDVVGVEEGRRAGAGGIDDGLAAEVLDGAGVVVDVVEGEGAGAREVFGEGVVGEGDGDSHCVFLLSGQVVKWLSTAARLWWSRDARCGRT